MGLIHCTGRPVRNQPTLCSNSKDLNYIVAEAEILHILVLLRVVYLSVYYVTQKIISLKFMK